MLQREHPQPNFTDHFWLSIFANLISRLSLSVFNCWTSLSSECRCTQWYPIIGSIEITLHSTVYCGCRANQDWSGSGHGGRRSVRFENAIYENISSCAGISHVSD